jgi:hypothetical protein
MDAYLLKLLDESIESISVLIPAHDKHPAFRELVEDFSKLPPLLPSRCESPLPFPNKKKKKKKKPYLQSAL